MFKKLFPVTLFTDFLVFLYRMSLDFILNVLWTTGAFKKNMSFEFLGIPTIQKTIKVPREKTTRPGQTITVFTTYANVIIYLTFAFSNLVIPTFLGKQWIRIR